MKVALIASDNNASSGAFLSMTNLANTKSNIMWFHPYQELYHVIFQEIYWQHWGR